MVSRVKYRGWETSARQVWCVATTELVLKAWATGSKRQLKDLMTMPQTSSWKKHSSLGLLLHWQIVNTHNKWYSVAICPQLAICHVLLRLKWMRGLLLFFLKESELGIVMYCLIIGHHYLVLYVTCISPAFPFDIYKGVYSVLERLLKMIKVWTWLYQIVPHQSAIPHPPFLLAAHDHCAQGLINLACFGSLDSFLLHHQYNVILNVRFARGSRGTFAA